MSDHQKPSEYVRSVSWDKPGSEQLDDMLDRVLEILDWQDTMIRVHQMRMDGEKPEEINKFIASRTDAQEEDIDA